MGDRGLPRPFLDIVFAAQSCPWAALTIGNPMFLYRTGLKQNMYMIHEFACLAPLGVTVWCEGCPYVVLSSWGGGSRVSAVVHGLRCVGQAVCAGMHSAEPCRSPFTPTPLYFTVVHFNLLMPCRTCMGRLDLLTHMTLAPLGVSNSFLEHVFANSYQCEFNLSSILFKFLLP